MRATTGFLRQYVAVRSTYATARSLISRILQPAGSNPAPLTLQPIADLIANEPSVSGLP